MQRLDALKRLAVFSNYAPLAITPDELQAMAANTTVSTIRARAQMTPRTFDISNNGFDGWFPEWLVDKVAQCKEDITLILDVRTPLLTRWYSKEFLLVAPGIEAICCILVPKPR